MPRIAIVLRIDSMIPATSEEISSPPKCVVQRLLVASPSFSAMTPHA